MLPRALIEIDRQEPTRLVVEQRIAADDMPAPQVINDDLIVYRDGGLTCAIRALASRLEQAESRFPLVSSKPVRKGQKPFEGSNPSLLRQSLVSSRSVRLTAWTRTLVRTFPDDFMFQLTASEWAGLRSQSVTLEAGRGRYRKYLPYAFTEQGVTMLSSVLRSDRGIGFTADLEVE